MLNHQLGRCSVPGVEYISNRRSRDTAVSHTRHMSLCILLEMEWTALPGDSGECVGKGSTNPLVIIAGDAVRPVHSSHHEALNEGSPVLSRFGKPDGNTRHHTPTCFRINTNGNKYSTITDDVVPSHLGISGIKEKRGYGRNGAISPLLKQGIKLNAALAYLSSRNAVAPTNLIHHVGDFAGRNTLQIHLGNSEGESRVHSRAAFKPGDDGDKRRLRLPYLRDIRSNLPGGGPNGTSFESIPLTIPCWYTFITFTF